MLKLSNRPKLPLHSRISDIFSHVIIFICQPNAVFNQPLLGWIDVWIFVGQTVSTRIYAQNVELRVAYRHFGLGQVLLHQQEQCEYLAVVKNEKN